MSDQQRLRHQAKLQSKSTPEEWSNEHRISPENIPYVSTVTRNKAGAHAVNSCGTWQLTSQRYGKCSDLTLFVPQKELLLLRPYEGSPQAAGTVLSYSTYTSESLNKLQRTSRNPKH